MADKDKEQSLLLDLALRGYQILDRRVIARSKTELVIRASDLQEGQRVILIAVPKEDGMFKGLGNDYCKNCFSRLNDSGECEHCNGEENTEKNNKKNLIKIMENRQKTEKKLRKNCLIG